MERKAAKLPTHQHSPVGEILTGLFVASNFKNYKNNYGTTIYDSSVYTGIWRNDHVETALSQNKNTCRQSANKAFLTKSRADVVL